jgi:hypothetical protein
MLLSGYGGRQSAGTQPSPPQEQMNLYRCFAGRITTPLAARTDLGLGRSSGAQMTEGPVASRGDRRHNMTECGLLHGLFIGPILIGREPELAVCIHREHADPIRIDRPEPPLTRE